MSRIAISILDMRESLVQMQQNVGAFGDARELFFGDLPGSVQTRLNLARPLGPRRCLVACLGDNVEGSYTYMIHVEGEGTYVSAEGFPPKSVAEVQVDEHFVYFMDNDEQEFRHLELDWAFLGSCRMWLRSKGKRYQIGVLSPGHRYTVLETSGKLQIGHLQDVWDTIRPGIVRLVLGGNEAADAWYAVFDPFEPREEELEEVEPQEA